MEIFAIPAAFDIKKKKTETGAETSVLVFYLQGGNTVNIYMGAERLKALKDEIEKFLSTTTG
jgi:hypothetical protein